MPEVTPHGRAARPSDAARTVERPDGLVAPERLSDVEGPPLGLGDLPVVRALALGLVAAGVDHEQATRDLAAQVTELALRRARRELIARPSRCPSESRRARDLLDDAIGLRHERTDAAAATHLGVRTVRSAVSATG